MAERSRGYALRVDISSEPERVWKALTTPSSMVRWCSTNARMTARAGGVFSGSLDRVTEFSAHIDVFEPPRRLRLIYLPSPAMPAGDSAVVDDLMLEHRDALTLVRVLGAGFPETPQHEAAMRRHHAGWRHALARLKVFIEKGLDRAEENPK
jgi:uncharacterized protein YndB with AHSA1/START domain